MNAQLVELLACPRCGGALELRGAGVRCKGCATEFGAPGGVLRLNDGARDRDPKIAAELEAQQHAKALYLDHRSIVNHVEEQILPRLAEWLEDAPGPILDLGCGVGHFGRTWAARGGGATLIGMDLVVELLDAVTAGYLGVVEGDVHRLPVQSGVLGAVVVANALHHMADPVHALGEMRRALRPGGVVVAYDPREVGAIELAKKVLRKHDHAFGAHHRAFRADEYKDMFARAGFTVDRFAMVDPLGPLVATGLDLIKAGKLGIAPAVAKVLGRVDAWIGKVDATRSVGLMLLARARA